MDNNYYNNPYNTRRIIVDQRMKLEQIFFEKERKKDEKVIPFGLNSSKSITMVFGGENVSLINSFVFILGIDRLCLPIFSDQSKLLPKVNEEIMQTSANVYWKLSLAARTNQEKIIDQIFTRIGASDDLISGQSTFMVEMLEANNALRYATKDSLIIFDEIGRGTATFDGMAIAQSIIEYIASSIQCITLFSTHYHELTMMDDSFHIQNVHASASIEDDHIVFLYKIKPGRSHRSYGINVAQLAKLPDEVIQRSQVILESLENNNIEKVISEKQEPQTIVKESVVEKALSRIDPMTLSPIEALSTLIELKKLL